MNASLKPRPLPSETPPTRPTAQPRLRAVQDARSEDSLPKKTRWITPAGIGFLAAALAIVSLGPSILLGVLAQRHLVRGLTLGAVRG